MIPLEIATLAYFLPRSLYGMLVYIRSIEISDIYLVTLDSLHELRQAFLNLLSARLILLIACTLLQANLTARLIQAGTVYGLFDRVLRSIYSFIYPYATRLTAKSVKVGTIYLGTATIAVLGLYAISKMSAVLVGMIFLPSLLDFILSYPFNARKRYLLGSAVTIFALAALSGK
jgi:hypothetical protein